MLFFHLMALPFLRVIRLQLPHREQMGKEVDWPRRNSQFFFSAFPPLLVFFRKLWIRLLASIFVQIAIRSPNARRGLVRDSKGSFCLGRWLGQEKVIALWQALFVCWPLKWESSLHEVSDGKRPTRSTLSLLGTFGTSFVPLITVEELRAM